MKNMLNFESLRNSALIVKSVYDSFPVEVFVDSVIDETWEGLELKARGLCGLEEDHVGMVEKWYSYKQKAYE